MICWDGIALSPNVKQDGEGGYAANGSMSKLF